MVKTLKLKASDGNALVFNRIYEDEDFDYSSLSLETGNVIVILGKERWFKRIRANMLSRLRPPYTTKRGSFFVGDEELEYFWILNLMEPHATLYGVPLKKNIDENGLNTIGDVDLFFHPFEGPAYPIMRLSADDIQSWLKILENTEAL
jgi:hypothetical protein